MLTKSEKSFAFIYTLILITELITATIESLNTLHFVAKPALLISLTIFFWKNSNHLKPATKNITLFALIFSLLGDILLMFVYKNPNFFIGGLVAFLIAHVMYVLVFLKSRDQSKNALPFIALMMLYATGLFYLIKANLGEMLIPVLVYMLAILSMSTSAFLRHRKTNSLSYKLVLFGAILFMISDSLIALNKFYEPLYLSNISIMVTYAIAQLSIVYGLLRKTESIK